MDLEEKWPGLTNNLVRDIYGTHKVFRFGAFKFQDYNPSDFKNDIVTAEKDILGGTICSNSVLDDMYFRRLSLHPRWLIRDDLFEILAFQFAVSKLVADGQFDSAIRIHSAVIPHSVVSLYDNSAEWESSFANNIEILESYGQSVALPEKVRSVKEISDCIQQYFQFVVNTRTQEMTLIFDRRGNRRTVHILSHDDVTAVPILVTKAIDELKMKKPKLLEYKEQIIEYFQKHPEIDAVRLAKMTVNDLAISLCEYCGTEQIKESVDELRKKILQKNEEFLRDLLSNLRSNHVIELQYHIQFDRKSNGKHVAVHLHFGDNQRIRFWPEQLIWFIPRLFLKDNSKSKEFLNRIYSNEYRHGFRVKLDDVVFSKYYKMLTGWTHESVNYHRSETINRRIGYPEYMMTEMREHALLNDTLRFLSEHHYDSDAISADVADVVGSN